MKVLVIDDDVETTKTLSKILDHMGFEFLVITDPMKGLKKIRREHFDCILLDMDMRVIRETGMIEMLAGADILKDQNVIVFSENHLSEIELKNLYRRDGIKGFFQKPIDFEKLINVILS